MARSAGVILIGDELLSGRTEDKNLPYIAKMLAPLGIEVRESRIIPDDEAVIIHTVNHFRKTFDYVFTTGGIGPTHDDLTMPSIAKAFGVEIYRNAEIKEVFLQHFGPNVPQKTLRMSDFPVGAELIKNTASVAPGFHMENVFVMAGIPHIMQAMLLATLPHLKKDTPILEMSITAGTSEGKISQRLEALQELFPEVKIGSYPFKKDGKPTVTLVVKSQNTGKLEAAFEALKTLLETLEAEIVENMPEGI